MSDIVTTFKALADDTRVRVLKLLGGGEFCVCEIAHALNLEQPRLSFHLRILKEAGIILDRRQERWILYRLNEEDMFIRFLLMAISEKIAPEQARKDQERLRAFGRAGRPCAGDGKKARPEPAAARSQRSRQKECQ
ncbi:MAG: metalloregulator ArsR/SmtB family transcription factor [Acidobacteria bacterium]|jgi:ArsR family transcriptional regulator|nr:metalloregulator ArsR/SmtB family transcription factor [Acidobacteriota bacterium]